MKKLRNYYKIDVNSHTYHFSFLFDYSVTPGICFLSNSAKEEMDTCLKQMIFTQLKNYYDLVFLPGWFSKYSTFIKLLITMTLLEFI